MVHWAVPTGASLFVDLGPIRRNPDFRRLFWGFSAANIGIQLGFVAVGLQVYALTGSTAAVGVLGLCALVPLLTVGPYGGALVDAYDRRTVTVLSSIGIWLPALGLAVQAWLDLDQVWLLYVLVGLQGAATAVFNPARSASLPRIVTPAELPAANALRSIASSSALAVGPLAGAVLVAAAGYGWAYTAQLLALGVAVWTSLRLPAMPPLPAEDGGVPGGRGLRSVVAGLRWLAGQREVRMTFVLDLVTQVLAQPRVVFPAVAAVYLGGGESVAGVLAAAVAVGSLLAGLLSGRLTRTVHQGRAIVVGTVGWGVAVTGFGVVLLAAGPDRPDHVVVWALVAAVLALALAGVSDTVSMVHRGTILQWAAPDALRGRLQGVFTVVVAGGPRGGEAVGGGVSGWAGEGVAMTVGGLACIVVTLVLVARFPAFWRYGFAAGERPAPRG
jgi:MFS family permease